MTKLSDKNVYTTKTSNAHNATTRSLYVGACDGPACEALRVTLSVRHPGLVHIPCLSDHFVTPLFLRRVRVDHPQPQENIC
jgi:hypothetical protein